MKMKDLQIDAVLYDYIARQTQHIGESASDILRRLLKIAPLHQPSPAVMTASSTQSDPSLQGDLQQNLQDLLLSEHYQRQKKAIGRFMLILSTLYTVDACRFAQATQAVQGRTRRYFATDATTLLHSGTHTQPQAVPGTPYWVITNTNSTRKRVMIRQILRILHLPASFIETIISTL